MDKLIKDFKDLERVSGQFLVVNVAKGVNNNTGNGYLSIELRDSSGNIVAKKWDSTANDETIFVQGNVVYIEGDTNKYKEALQLKILSAKLVPLDEIDPTKFVKAPPVPAEELANRYNNYVESIKNEDAKKLVKYLVEKFKDKLYVYPAAVSIHHEYASGLLMHSTTMARVAEELCKIYDLDRDILISGILLHDIGKCIEFEGPAVYKYSLEGKLLGHISIMVSELRKAAEKLNITSEVPLLLEHMVLSHHDKPEYGSPVPPLTKEALALTIIDNLDSKMVILDKALEVTEEGEFSAKIFALDNRMFYKPIK